MCNHAQTPHNHKHSNAPLLLWLRWLVLLPHNSALPPLPPLLLAGRRAPAWRPWQHCWPLHACFMVLWEGLAMQRAMWRPWAHGPADHTCLTRDSLQNSGPIMENAAI
jgi:hypothetical protein